MSIDRDQLMPETLKFSLELISPVTWETVDRFFNIVLFNLSFLTYVKYVIIICIDMNLWKMNKFSVLNV
jgi:hypothetical protein